MSLLTNIFSLHLFLINFHLSKISFIKFILISDQDLTSARSPAPINNRNKMASPRELCCCCCCCIGASRPAHWSVAVPVGPAAGPVAVSPVQRTPEASLTPPA